LLFLVFVWFNDSYSIELLYISLASIAVFIAIEVYAIYNKQFKSYLKSIFWVIGTPLAIIITYISVAILTHDPIVPRPLTVHQLLTGYNIVYTHDGKLYQNDEYVMDLNIFSWEDNIAGNRNWDCSSCIHWRLDVYWSLYLWRDNGFKYEVNMSDNNSEIKKVEKIPFFLWYKTKPYYRDWPHPTRYWWPILSNNLWYLIKSPLPKEEKHREEYVNNRYYAPNQYHYTRLMLDNDGNITNTIEIKNEMLKEIIVQKYITWYDINRSIELNIIWIANQKPVIEIIQGQARYVLQWSDILLQNHHSINIHDNNVYSLSNFSHVDNYGIHRKKVYKNWEEYWSSPVSFYFDGANKMIQDWFCPISTPYWIIGSLFCNINGKLRDTPVLTLFIAHQLNIPIAMRSLLEYGWVPNILNWAVTHEWFISTITSKINIQENKNKLFRYHNVISNIIGYLYQIRGSFNSFKGILNSKNLYRILSDHYFSTDTIFLRPFHNSGREYSEVIPLISGIDNFFGIYPITPPENNDPNADINVGQLLMDTYFPEETKEVEIVDEKALLLELLQQRELRLNESDTME
jgi:hypothetical protein